METPQLRLAFGALRRFGVDRFRRRGFSPPALERCLIAFPRFGQGIVAGQITRFQR